MKGTVHVIALLSLASASCASGGAPPPQRSFRASSESEAVARHFLGDRDGSARRAAPAYRWLTVGRLYWVSGPVDSDLLVAVPGDGHSDSRFFRC